LAEALVENLQVHGLRTFALGVRQSLEVDLLAFDQLREAGALNSADVDEHVRAAAVRRDEAEAAGAVEELHDAILRIAERRTRGTIAAAEAAATATFTTAADTATAATTSPA